MKQTIWMGLTLTLLTGAAMAEPANLQDMSYQEKREAIKNMSPEQRQAFMKARKKEWDSLSQEEKIKRIEKRRAEFLAEREKIWNSLSDEEKIEKAEKRLKKMHMRQTRHKHQAESKNDASQPAANE